MQPLSGVIEENTCHYQKYADDTELSSSAKPASFTEATSKLSKCTCELKDWMSSNKLKLNTEKTELLKVGTTHTLSKLNNVSVNISGCDVNFQSSIKYLGVHLDPTLSMSNQISSVCRSCFHELRQISTIKKYLSRDALQKLVSAKILSRIDYCNSLYYGITDDQRKRLIRIQNAAARMILGKKKT